MQNNIHPTVIIEDDVEMGFGNTIEAYSIIKSGTKLGNNNVVRSFSILGETPTAPNYAGLYSNLLIGNNNLFACHTIVQKGNGLNKSTKIGNNNSIYSQSIIGYNCTLGDNNFIIAQVGLASNIKIGNNVTICPESGIAVGNTMLVDELVIGDHSYIGSFSKIGSSVPPFMLIAGGYKCKIINYNNMKLNFILKEYPEIDESFIKEITKILIKNKSNKIILQELSKYSGKFIDKLISFYTSQSSVVRG